MTDTKDQILDAAEHLFARDGYGATSLRSVLAEAGVNPAAAHYHFGGKEPLLLAVIARRVEPLNAERLRRLEILEDTAAGGAIAVAELVDAFVAPALEMSSTDATGERFCRLLGRIYKEADADRRAALLRQFEPVVTRFASALRRELRQLDETAFRLRFHCVIGVLSHAMASPELEGFGTHATSGEVADGAVEATQTTVLIREVVRFATAGLMAPCSELAS